MRLYTSAVFTNGSFSLMLGTSCHPSGCRIQRRDSISECAGEPKRGDESQLLSASNGDYTGRKWLPGKKPEKLNKKRSLPLNQLSITKLGWPAKQELSFPQEYDPPALG